MSLCRSLPFLVTALFFLGATPSSGEQITDAFAPEAATATKRKASGQSVSAKRWMISVANPLAAKVGANVLSRGGSAADAAIAVQLMLGLVEPQSSGLGGGAFLLYFDANAGKLTTLDGRETAPASATGELFFGDDGKPLKFFDAVIGGRSVGVPGTPALLADMHRRWGTLPRADLYQPTIELARSGFAVSPRLAGLVERGRERLSRHPATAAYFLPGGVPVRTGEVLKNPAYAKTLETMLREGEEGFYSGDIARAIVETVQGFAANPGDLTMEDMAGYTVRERAPVCPKYRGLEICGMGPPSSGGLTVGQILKLLEPYKIGAMSADSAATWRLIGDATRLAFADRGLYMADSDFVKVPVKGLIDDAYLRDRATLLAPGDRLEETAPGIPPWKEGRLKVFPGQTFELPSTTHFSIVDSRGNVVSMTSTIESGFGSRLMAAGFLLNNELTDFSFRPERDGKPVANRVEGGKRPRSSMAPTIVMKDGKPYIVIGSPGGSRIIPYVANTLIRMIDWSMDVQGAISAPHLVNRFGTYDLEAGTNAERLAGPLSSLGYQTKIRTLTSGLHGIVFDNGGLRGGADPRREGIVLGE